MILIHGWLEYNTFLHMRILSWLWHVDIDEWRAKVLHFHALTLCTWIELEWVVEDWEIVLLLELEHVMLLGVLIFPNLVTKFRRHEWRSFEQALLDRVKQKTCLLWGSIDLVKSSGFLGVWALTAFDSLWRIWVFIFMIDVIHSRLLDAQFMHFLLLLGFVHL